MSLGIDEVITELYAGGGKGGELSGIQNLIMAGTMGDTHKVLLQCTSKYRDTKPRGFLLKNEIGRL